MSTTYTQDKRRMWIDTPLGKDVLLMLTFRAKEEISKLFEFELELRSANDSIGPTEIVGKNVTFAIDRADGSLRHFNGHVKNFAYCGRGDRLSNYRATVVPWFWFLTQSSDCRIFQDMSVPEIIDKIFGEFGFSDYELKLSLNHKKRVYCVQYRETHFEFLTRLMEESGIFYFFKHEDGKHTLIIGDSPSAYYDCQEQSVQLAANLAGPESTDHLSHWEHAYEFVTGKWMHQDYNFETPDDDLKQGLPGVVRLDGTKKYEKFDYPGYYGDRPEGKDLAELRMGEIEGGYDTAYGEGHCRNFSPGGKFTIKKHHSDDEAGKAYVLTVVEHEGSMGSTYVTNRDGEGFYRNSFHCIPDSMAFRPPRLTPQPKIYGVQTALVVGPAGQEIWPDKYGRVKVQFYWDRYGSKDENSSCWIRCAQVAAGRNWGAMSIPRVGQEVIVDFEEGDPNRPLITGVVYNAGQMPAYALPDHKTRTYIKSNSSPGGEGFNEIRFEDRAGEEQIFIHGQKDLDIRVLNDRREQIDHDRHVTIGLGQDDDGNDTKLMHGNELTTIKKNQETTIGENREFKVAKDNDESIGGAEVVTVGGNRDVLVQGNLTHETKGVHTLKATSLHFDGGGDVNGTANSISLKGATTAVLEAGAAVSLKVGGSFVTVSSAGVFISGPTVMINSGGSSVSAMKNNAKKAKQAKAADPKQPNEADNDVSGSKSS